MIPKTRYAQIGDSYVAYQVLGDGPVDLVYVFGFEGHVEAQWDYPQLARFLERLASFSRLIYFNRRGSGMSDPIDPTNITLEQWMEDVRAVMDAAGSERAVIVGGTEGGPMAILFAATHPERTAGLVLGNTWASTGRTADGALSIDEATRAAIIDQTLRSYMDPDDAGGMWRRTFPVAEAAHVARLFRFATSPGQYVRHLRATAALDVRHVLPSVRVPTLVLSREGRLVTHEVGRRLAARIPGAKHVELPGEEFFLWSGDQESVIAEIEEFVTGARPAPEPDRVLATVLFTDIVSSTERAAGEGDRRWRGILDEHNRIVRRELERHRGREVSTAGDGFLATFDGPARAVRCACAIVDAVRVTGLDVRAGLHTGEIELAGDNVAGIGVHIGQRVSALAGPGEVLVSRTVVDLVAGSGLSFADRGSHALKGVPGEWQLHAVERP